MKDFLNNYFPKIGFKIQGHNKLNQLLASFSGLEMENRLGRCAGDDYGLARKSSPGEKADHDYAR